MALQDQILVVIKASADGAIRELDQVGMSAKGADSQAINLGKTLKAGLVAGATALAGAGLVSYLNDSVTAFQEAQVAASQFARATNATVEEAGKFTTVAGALGLEMNDLIEINAEFSKKVQEQPGLLKALNVEVAKNADGSVNMTRTLVATIDALGSMEDGLLAAQTAAQLFGEEGSKQLAGFYLQGIKVSDLMDRIDFVDRSDDAKEYAAATIEMNLAMQQLQVTIGAALVPVLTELIDAGLAVTGFLKEIPGPVYLIVGAFVAWEVAVRTGLVAKAFPLLIEGLLNVTAAFLSPKLAMQAFGDGLVALGKKAAPLAALAAAVFVVTDALKSASEAGDFIKNTDNVTQSLEDQANQLRDNSSWWNRFVSTTETTMQLITQQTKEAAAASLENANASEAEKKAAQDLLDVMGDGTLEQQTANLATEEGQAAQAAYAASLSASAAAQEESRKTLQDLNDATADFVISGGDAATTWDDIAQAARDASAANAEQTRAQELANIALGIYATTVQGVVDWQSRLNGLLSGAEEGLNGVQSAYATLAATTDDPQTWGDETVIQAGKARDAIWSYVGTLAESGLTSDEIITKLIEIKSNSDDPALIADIDSTIAAITGKTNEIPVNLLPFLDPEAAGTAQGAVDALGNPVTVPVGADASGLSEAEGRKDALSQPIASTITWDTKFEPGGYNAVKARLDYLIGPRAPKIAYNTTFNPGGYLAAKARYDYLTRDRTVTINYQTTGATGGTGGTPGTGSQLQPINMVRVSVDGRELRSVIRSEVSRALPAPVGVA